MSAMESGKFIRLAGGNQEKWVLPSSNIHVKAAYTKHGIIYKDYICEELACKIGSQFGFDMSVNKACRIVSRDGENIAGSYSKIFLTDSEELVPMSLLLEKHLTDKVCKSWDRLSIRERLERVLSICTEDCRLISNKYILDMVTLDYLIGNVDRHMSNFGVLYDFHTQEYRFPPHFDNGLSLFEFDGLFNGLTLEESMNRLYAQPFGDYFQEVYQVAVNLLGSGSMKVCRLTDLVFPSRKAFDYFEYVTKKLNIPLIGEATWIGD